LRVPDLVRAVYLAQRQKRLSRQRRKGRNRASLGLEMGLVHKLTFIDFAHDVRMLSCVVDRDYVGRVQAPVT